MAKGLVMVVMMVMAMAGLASAWYPKLLTPSTFEVAGRKFALDNVPFGPGGPVVCPEGHPSTVTFCKTGKMQIVGNFQAVGLGVCSTSINPYTVTPSEVLTYAQYGYLVVVNSSFRVSLSFQSFVQDHKLVTVGGSFLGVSYLKDLGPATC